MHRSARSLSIAIAAVAAIAVSGPACADGVKGFEAYEKGDYATAMKEFMPLAAAGQTSAQAAVGQMYFEGKGVKPDPAEAAKWLEPAAKAGNARAQFLLGKLYLSGEGVAAADPAKALALSKAAADQGMAEAQVDTCALYYQGVGVPKDLTQAYLYATLAARQGNEDGKNILELLTQDMKPEDVAKGDAAVKAWKQVLPDIQDPNP
ncbi:MAG TPA: tetratricopeptide repeat protein [Candidatus Cybelea sp.]|nr:tetratricopeptide repeat protein [Candidatus Cybelea sp.]